MNSVVLGVNELIVEVKLIFLNTFIVVDKALRHWKIFSVSNCIRGEFV